MATVHKGGRKKEANRDRYADGRTKPVSGDFGPVEQRLKREVAAGTRTFDESAKIFGLLS